MKLLACTTAALALVLCGARAQADQNTGIQILKGIACGLDPSQCAEAGGSSRPSGGDPSPGRENVYFKNKRMYVENPGPQRQRQCEEAGDLCIKTIDGTIIIDTRPSSVKKRNFYRIPITDFYSFLVEKDSVRFDSGRYVEFNAHIRSKADRENKATVFDWVDTLKTRPRPGSLKLGGQVDEQYIQIRTTGESYGFAESKGRRMGLVCDIPVVFPNGKEVTDLCEQLSF